MDKSGRSSVRDILVNRAVAWVFGVLAVFILILQAINQLDLDPFANIIVRLLLLPGYVVMLGYIVLLVNLVPDVGRIGWLIGLVLYLYVVSVVIVGIYRKVRRSHPFTE